MKLLDLFSGTRSISKAFEKKGHEVFTVEIDKHHENIDLYADILQVTSEDIINLFGKPDVIWASPPCTTYSIAAISHHRIKESNGNLSPKSEQAKIADRLVKHALKLISELKPRFFLLKIQEAVCVKWNLCLLSLGTPLRTANMGINA